MRRHGWHEAGPADARLPQMMAWTDPTGAATDLSSVSPLGGYSGLENQLYRVEIHLAAMEAGAVTFKWSRENGSVVAAWLRLDGNDLVVDGLHDTLAANASGPAPSDGKTVRRGRKEGQGISPWRAAHAGFRSGVVQKSGHAGFSTKE